MEDCSLLPTILGGWRRTVQYVAGGHASEFIGQRKETEVLEHLRTEIENRNPHLSLVGPKVQARFASWNIDLTCSDDHAKVAVEGKFKIVTDAAVPDNRKAAFLDLFKLEKYVDSGEYNRGLFLWLTNQRAYLRKAHGDSADFSTHHGRVYEAGVPLSAKRSRSPMPLPLTLRRSYAFNWEAVGKEGTWHHLILIVEPLTP